MPSLIRLIVVLLILGGLVFGAMVALVAIVRPTPDEVTVRIPATDLLGEPGPSGPALPGLGSSQPEPEPEPEPETEPEAETVAP